MNKQFKLSSQVIDKKMSDSFTDHALLQTIHDSKIYPRKDRQIFYRFDLYSYLDHEYLWYLATDLLFVAKGCFFDRARVFSGLFFLPCTNFFRFCFCFHPFIKGTPKKIQTDIA